MKVNYIILFFYWNSLHARLNSLHSLHAATSKYGLAGKSTKRLKHTGNLFRKNMQLKVVLILYLKPLRLWVKVKHSIGREFQNLTV